MHKRFLLVFIGVSALMAAGCQNGEETSELAAAPQTPTRDQGRIGFCWSYTAIALLESEILKKTGQRVDLSEEYIGFLHMSYQLSNLANAYYAKEITEVELEEYILEYPSEGGYVAERPNSKDAFMQGATALIDMFGVVEESRWSVKFKSYSDLYNYTAVLKRNFLSFVKENNSSSRRVDAMTIARKIAEWNNLPAFPTSSIQPKQKWGINLRAYSYLTAHSAVDFDSVLLRVQKAVDDGFSVPIEVAIDWTRMPFQFGPLSELQSSGGANAIQQTSRAPFVNGGGHAMLVYDVKRENSSGSVENGGFHSLLLKNSWGTGKNEFGKEITDSGNYFITRDYLVDSLGVRKVGFVLPPGY